MSLRHLSTGRSTISDRHTARHPPRDLQQIGLHVDDLVFWMPFAGEEVLQAVGLETDRAVDEVWQPSRLNMLRDNQAWETVA